MSKHYRILWLAAITVLVVCPSAFAQAPQGHIAYMYPAGGQQGTTVEATISGGDLVGASEIRVSGGGVTGKVVDVQKGKTSVKVKVSVTIAKDAAPGQRDLRLITPGGATNRTRFIVGQLPEVIEEEENSKVAEAQPISTVPAVVNGQIFGADTDIFRFSAKAGQTIVCRAQAQELLPFIADAVPGWFQAVLTLRDAKGNELAYVDDFRFHPDPVLIYEVERDGDYLIEIRDSIYRGRGDFVYRLSVGALPYLTHVYPLGAPRNSTAKLELCGVNLPKKDLALKLTDQSPKVEDIQLDGKIDTNALPFAVGRMPETDESEPNDTAEKANKVEVPRTINGQIGKPGDMDCFAFDATAKQQLVIDVVARRLDSPLDSIITLFDPAGRPVAKNDDFEDKSQPLITHHADSRLTYTFKVSGRHVLRITDVQSKGGSEFAYRVSISRPRPDFELRVVPDNPRMGQGATAVLTVHALRRDGFNGPIKLTAKDLPPGFTANGTMIAEGESEVLVTLTSPSDAPLGIVQPTIVGRATIGDKQVNRKALPAEDVMQAFIYHHLLPTEEFLLTVVKPGPFKLIPQLPQGFVRFGAGRTAFFNVKVERTDKAKGPIRLVLHNPPKGVRMKTVTLTPGKDEAKCEVRYPNQSPSNIKYNLIVSGQMKSGKDVITTISPVVVAVGPGYKFPGAKGKPAAQKTPPKAPPKTAPKTPPKPSSKPEAKPQPKKPLPKKPTKLPPLPGIYILKNIDLTEDQKAEIWKIHRSMAPRLQAMWKEMGSILTDEQKAARKKAIDEAKAAGKSSKEIWLAGQDAAELTDAQKAKEAKVRKTMQEIQQEVRKKIVPILTEQQKQILKNRGKQK